MGKTSPTFTAFFLPHSLIIPALLQHPALPRTYGLKFEAAFAIKDTGALCVLYNYISGKKLLPRFPVYMGSIPEEPYKPFDSAVAVFYHPKMIVDPNLVSIVPGNPI